MSLLQLLSGAVQGYAQQRQKQIGDTYQDKMFKLRAKQYEDELREQETIRKAREQFFQMIGRGAQPREIERPMPPSPSVAAGPGMAGGGGHPGMRDTSVPMGTETVPGKGLIEQLVDPEFKDVLDLGVKGGLVDISTLATIKNQMETRQLARDKHQQDILEFEAEKKRLATAAQHPGKGYEELPVITVDAEGNRRYQYRPIDPKTRATDAGVKETLRGIERVYAGLSKDPSKPWSLENMTDETEQLGALIGGYGIGKEWRDELAGSAIIAFQRGGTALTDNEKKVTLDVLIPGMDDLLAGISTTPVESIKRSVYAKMERARKLLLGQLSPAEQKKMLAEMVAAAAKRGDDLSGLEVVGGATSGGRTSGVVNGIPWRLK